jgi:F-type H+-transporting ATPase subunit epsilon
MPTMKLEIVTAERLVYEDQVNVVVAPGIEGQLGILPHHAALLTTLQSGELTIRKDGEEDVYMAISGGFLEVMNNRVVVLADTAERADEIDENRAEEAMRRAQEDLDARTEDVNLERALTSIMRSQTRLKVVRRRRRSPQSTS